MANQLDLLKQVFKILKYYYYLFYRTKIFFPKKSYSLLGEDLFIDKIYNIFNTLAFSPQRHFEGTFEDSTLFTKYPIIKELNNNAKVSQTEKTMLVQESSTIVF